MKIIQFLTCIMLSLALLSCGGSSSSNNSASSESAIGSLILQASCDESSNPFCESSSLDGVYIFGGIFTSHTCEDLFSSGSEPDILYSFGTSAETPATSISQLSCAGSGICDVDITKFFNPTTKAQVEGIGIGSYTLATIIDVDANGEVDFESGDQILCQNDVVISSGANILSINNSDFYFPDRDLVDFQINCDSATCPISNDGLNAYGGIYIGTPSCADLLAGSPPSFDYLISDDSGGTDTPAKALSCDANGCSFRSFAYYNVSTGVLETNLIEGSYTFALYVDSDSSGDTGPASGDLLFCKDGVELSDTMKLINVNLGNDDVYIAP